jgi:hypothetical protein
MGASSRYAALFFSVSDRGYYEMSLRFFFLCCAQSGSRWSCWYVSFLGFVMMGRQGDWMCISARCNSNRRSLSRDDFEIFLIHGFGG